MEDKIIDAFTEIGIMLTDDDGNYKDVKDIFDELSEVWSNLDEGTKQLLFKPLNI